MLGDERLERLDRIYSIFNRFQIATLIAGTLAATLATMLSSDICGTLYMMILFGQVIAFILFGIITMNMTDATMQKRYPDVKARKSLSIGLRSFGYSEDLNGPMIEKIRKTHDQLAKDVYKKIGKTWLLCILNVFIPTIALYMARMLIS